MTCFSGSSDAILCLVNAQAKVEATDNDGLTALHCAASRGHHDCIDTLIGLCGAEVDVRDQNGSSPLFYAVTLGHAECTSQVLKAVFPEICSQVMSSSCFLPKTKLLARSANQRPLVVCRETA